MRFVRFRALHLLEIEPQGMQLERSIRPEHGLALQTMGGAWTGLVNDRPVASAGVIDDGDGRGTAWALIGDEGLQHILAIHRRTFRFLERTEFRRIETAVRHDHHAGHRWAARLGFQPEGIMRSWFWDGADAVRYARVRGA